MLESDTVFSGSVELLLVLLQSLPESSQRAVQEILGSMSPLEAAAIGGGGVVSVVGTLGFKPYSSKAFKTVRHEPWYALIALGVGGALGWALFMAQPGLLEVLGVR